MILQPLSSNNVSDFTLRLVTQIIKNNNIITSKSLKECFRRYIYSRPNSHFIKYYMTCLGLMTINLSDQTILSVDENNNIIII